MHITRDDLQWAAAQRLITPRQADDVWNALEVRVANRPSPAGEVARQAAADKPRFDAAHVAYYFGALIVIGAMGWFMSQAWERFGGGGILAISSAYAFCFWMAGRTLWDQNDLRVPGGLLFTMAVCMTPLAMYGFERMTNIWPQNDPGFYDGFHVWVNGGWFLMEVATLIAGCLALYFRRFAFLMAPVAFVIWYMSMDLTPIVFGRDYDWHYREWMSVMVGLAMLLAAYLLDLRSRVGQDFAFWGYLFGLMAFWGGLSMMNSGSELARLEYCAINVGLVVISVLLRQRSFIVFGSMGVMGYIGHLAYRVFENSLLFPFVLTIVGIAIIYLGVLYQRHHTGIENAVRDRLPDAIEQLVPPRVRALA